jgi:hypothetical protein
LVAAPGRSRMRLWSRDTQKFTGTAKRTDRLPRRPAATRNGTITDGSLYPPG